MYDIMISCYDIIYDIICIAFLALYDIVKKLWYHIWYHILKYDIIYDIIKTIIKSLSCAILLWFRLLYHIHFIRFCLWYQKLMILSMISPMIWPSDISNLVYHRPLISQISWYLSLYHSACGTWKFFKLDVTLTYKLECPSHIQPCSPVWLLIQVLLVATVGSQVQD